MRVIPCAVLDLLETWEMALHVMAPTHHSRWPGESARRLADTRLSVTLWLAPGNRPVLLVA
jgi:hypothetical protein